MSGKVAAFDPGAERNNVTTQSPVLCTAVLLLWYRKCCCGVVAADLCSCPTAGILTQAATPATSHQPGLGQVTSSHCGVDAGTSVP